MKKLYSEFVCCSLLAVGVLPLAAQTFEIGGKPPAASAPSPSKPDKKQKPPKAGAPAASHSWGSSIEVGRRARAAQDALRRGNPAAAAGFAQRAVEAAPQNADLWFLLGYTSRLAGRYSQSLQAYQRGLQLKGNSAEGLAGLAQTYAKLGRRDEARRLLVQAIQANPKNVNNMLVLGELYIQAGEYQQGIPWLQRAASAKPSAHSDLLLAVAYMKLKQPEKARQLLARAKARDPKNVAIYRAVATFQREEKDYKGAIATLKSAPRLTAEVLGDLGYSYELAGQKKESADAYGKAANAAPGKIGYQLSAAQAAMRTGDAEKSKQFLGRAAKLDPNHYRLHAIQGAMAKSANRDDEAIREYTLALSRLPEAATEGPLYPIQLRLNLSELYKNVGNETAAKQQLALAEQQISAIKVEGPALAEFLRVRASIKAGSGDLAGAQADLQQALKLDPENTNATLQYANVLWKGKRRDEARKLYADVLAKDPKNRFALESLGYLSRAENNRAAAEEFFNRLAAAYPDDYVAHVALGDMYTDTRDFARAEDSYQKAYQRAPKNPIIIANAANAAIESRKFELAKVWVDRATGAMNDDPRVMRERERYLFHSGKYLESAQLGYKVLERLPRDRNASVYLAYALYNLGRYDDVLSLANQYESILVREPNFPLLQGHVHKQSQLLDQAVDDYTRAIARDPKLIEGYINRGYVRNDLQDPELASEDFIEALRLNPNNGTAHLGLAFSSLQLKRGKRALDEVDIAEKLLGESGATHLARATAYRQLRDLSKAEKEYRAALKYTPDDVRLHMALANTLYYQRRYNESVDALNQVLRLSPDDPLIYAQLAHAHAQLGHQTETMQYVAAAEREGADQSGVLLATGDALFILGDEDAAMDRFARALEAPDASRVDARLAIARLFVRKGEFEDAKQQVSLAFAESRVGEASPVTADNLIEAANIFLASHDFTLAEKYYSKARDAGAGEQAVAIGLANTYLAQGDALNAQAQLASLGNPADYEQNFDYLLAMGNVYRQRQDAARALSFFARASALGADNEVAQRQMHEMAAQEGLRITPRFSVLSHFDFRPIFEPATVYELDAKIRGVTDPALMPPPRSSIETILTSAYRFHQNGLPTISGFFQIRNARGQASIPSEGFVITRNTTDYSFNTGVTPVLHLGKDNVVFNAGVQFTARRDSDVPITINQNLLRGFVHISTSSFGNWLALRGSAYHESGSFTNRDLKSRDVGASLEFTVGRPWGKTALITGYSARDLQFDPLVREFFTTSTYLGLERNFGSRLKVRALGEYVRAWRVQNTDYATAQMMRPTVELQYRPNARWSVEGRFALSRGQGFHTYDNMQSGLFISYMRPWRWTIEDGAGKVPVEYPLRFSIGFQQQSFSNFTGRDQASFRPVFRLSLF